MPITRSGSGTLAASRVMGIEEVLLARTASWGITLARPGKHLLLTSSFSVTASTANCAERASSRTPAFEPRQGRLRVLRLQLALANRLVQLGADAGQPFLHQFGTDVDQHDMESALRPCLGDSRAHLPGPHDRQHLDVHDFTPPEEARR